MQQNMEAALCNITDNTYRGANQGGRKVNQYTSFKDFMDTKPAVFKEAAKPLEANEWINTMEHKFRLLQMTKELRQSTWHISWRGLLGFGGPTIIPPIQREPRSLGTASPPLSGEITFLQV